MVEPQPRFEVIESFVLGRRREQSLSEDVIAVYADFAAVIDGVSDRTGELYDGMLGGRWAALKLAAVIESLPADVAALAAVEQMSAALEPKLPVTSTLAPPGASVLLYSAMRREVWSIGDCQLLVDNQVTKAKLSKGVRNKLSTPGPRGPKGPQGATGATGAQGPAGQSLIANETTAPSSEFPGTAVVDVPALPLSSGGPTAGTGSQLVDPIELDEGSYKVEGTAQFFDFEGGPTAGDEYGVVKLMVDGVSRATLWTGDVPDDGNNAAQANGSLILNVPAGGATLSVEAAMRSAEGDGGQAGGNLIVTKIG